MVNYSFQIGLEMLLHLFVYKTLVLSELWHKLLSFKSVNNV